MNQELCGGSQERNRKIASAFESNPASNYFQDCKRYVDMLEDPTLKPWSPLREHAIHSIIDTTIVNPALEEGSFDHITTLAQAKKLESSIRDAIK